MSAAGTIIYFFRCLKPYRIYALGTYLMMFLIALLSVAIPQFIRWIVDRGIRREDLSLLAVSVAALLLLAALRGVCTFFQGRWSEIASQGVAFDLRNALHRKLASLSFSYHDAADTGQLLSRSIQDVERIRFLTGRAFLRVVEGAVLFLAIAVAMLIMDIQLALLSLAVIPILGIQSYRYGSRIRPLSVEIQDQLGVLTTRVQQNLNGIRIVKAFALEEDEIRRFEAENDRWFSLSLLAARIDATQLPLLQFLANMGTVAVILFGGIAVINGRISLGEFVAFSTYLGQLVMPVRRIGNVIPALAQAAASGERIREILEAISEVNEKPDAYDVSNVQGAVQFENVTFSYFGRHMVLDGISFQAEPGQVIALIGGPGSGKSTIINLIPRFYDTTAGRITVDGNDIQNLTLASLRRNIGIVLQETLLFSGTIRSNIAFGMPDADENAIREAAKAAQAHEFIIGFPDGYGTWVGERGVTLSGGQKQRIAIARVLLRNPRILILDDATSSVDTETERLIRDALKLLMQGRTSFVIAHRLGTVLAADLIIVLEGGRIIARGTHQQLLEASGSYVEIFESQFRPQHEMKGKEHPDRVRKEHSW